MLTIAPPNLTAVKRMTDKSFGRFFVAFALAVAASAPWTSVTAGETHLELLVENERAELALGEPVYLIVRLINGGRTPVNVTAPLSLQAHNVIVYWTTPNGESRRFLPLFYADLTVPEVQLEPGDQIAAVLPVSFGSMGWSLAEPGQYDVHVTLVVGQSPNTHTLRSNTLNLHVSDQDPLGARLVDGSSTSREAGKFLLWHQGDHLMRGQALLEDVVREDPQSVLSDYSRLALGRNLARSFRDYSRDRVRPADCIAALGWLEAVRVTRLPPYLQILHALSSASCHAALGDVAVGRQFREVAKRLARGRPEFAVLVRTPSE